MAAASKGGPLPPSENTSLPMPSVAQYGSHPRFSATIPGDLDPLPLNMTTSGSRCASVVYRKSSAAYGSEQPDRLVRPAFGLSSTFSSGLAHAGMYKRQGLEASIARDRVVEGSKDWLMKIL